MLLKYLSNYSDGISYLSEILCREPLYLCQLHLRRRLSVGELGMLFFWCCHCIRPLSKHVLAWHCDVKGFAICGYCIAIAYITSSRINRGRKGKEKSSLVLVKSFIESSSLWWANIAMTLGSWVQMTGLGMVEDITFTAKIPFNIDLMRYDRGS